MNEWIKFKDKTPPIGSEIWMSDGKTCWESIGVNILNKDIYWMERINPEPPEKEKHFCEAVNVSCFCCEVTGNLYLDTFNKMGRRIEIKIIACPFCGFTL